MRKINRLCNAKDFDRVIKGKLRTKNGSFSIIASKQKLKKVKVGISTSKKLGKAHERNRMRRQVRAMIDSMNITKKSFDILIIVKEDFKNKSYQENFSILKTSLTNLFKSEGL